jgi:chromate transporter
MTITMDWSQWLQLFLQFALLSMLSIGGAIVTAPEMHRYLVIDQQWLTESQFGASIAIAQAAPGPNVMFVALMGWQVGQNAGGLGGAWIGMMATMLGILLPSTTVTYLAAKWGHDNRERRSVKAFKQGLAPVVIALLVATGWILSTGHTDWRTEWPKWLLTVFAALLVWRTKIHLLWLLGLGASLGAIGWV